MEEREHREEVVRSAQASLFLSGFEISPEEKAHARRFIEGEIQIEQFLRSGRPHHISAASAEHGGKTESGAQEPDNL
ncbi:MAG: antitoxin VbhA family protein [Candidatus Obscuribacterales bacterium]|nr:antitoxin VbhA family protein [Steroidobacteraceae bacterium]